MLLAENEIKSLIQKQPNKNKINQMMMYQSRLRVMSEPLFFYELEQETGWSEIKMAIRNSVTPDKYERILNFFSYPLAITSIGTAGPFSRADGHRYPVSPDDRRVVIAHPASRPSRTKLSMRMASPWGPWPRGQSPVSPTLGSLRWAPAPCTSCHRPLKYPMARPKAMYAA